MLFQIQESELLKDAIKKLTEISNSPEDLQKNLHTVIHSLKHSLNNSIKKDFDYYFLQVHPKFYDKLLEKHPTLTQYDLRLCALVKLNLTTKDISTILNINSDSVKMARKRLRKKLNMTNPDDSLINFLSQFESN